MKDHVGKDRTESQLAPLNAAATRSRWRIVACDLDGTLIGWNHKINDRDIAAVARARAAGIHVAICTGRNSRESAGVVAAIGAEGLGVFVNGAMVCRMENGSAVHSTFVADELREEAVQFFGSRGHAVLVLADDAATRMPVYCLTDHAPPHRATTDWLLYNRVHAQAVAEVPAGFRGRTVRLGTVVNVDQAETLHAQLKAQFGPRCSTHSIYSPHYDCQIIEVFHAAVNKWTGLEHLADVMGVKTSEILAVGDDINDLAMLRGAALSFAMGNAVEAVKREAKRVTAAQSECGVAMVIEALLAGNLEAI